MPKGKKKFQEYKGIKFNNETEVEFYKMCELALSEGRIKSFIYEVEYELFSEFKDWRGDKVDSISHSPDFIITLNDDSIIVVDTKGGNSKSHDKISLIKRKIWMYYNQEVPYYMISKLPVYMGAFWTETSIGRDMSKKLVSIYDKIYPNQNKRLKTTPKFIPKDWHNYMEFHDVCGLFYTYDKIYTKKDLEKISKQNNKK